MVSNSRRSQPALNISVYLRSHSCRGAAPDSLSERFLMASGLKTAHVGHTSQLLTACCRIASLALRLTKKTSLSLLTMAWRLHDLRILRPTRPIPDRHVFCQGQSYHHCRA